MLYHRIVLEFFNHSDTLLVSQLQLLSGAALCSAPKTEPVGVDRWQSREHTHHSRSIQWNPDLGRGFRWMCVCVPEAQLFQNAHATLANRQQYNCYLNYLVFMIMGSPNR